MLVADDMDDVVVVLVLGTLVVVRGEGAADAAAALEGVAVLVVGAVAVPLDAAGGAYGWYGVYDCMLGVDEDTGVCMMIKTSRWRVSVRWLLN